MTDTVKQPTTNNLAVPRQIVRGLLEEALTALMSGTKISEERILSQWSNVELSDEDKEKIKTYAKAYMAFLCAVRIIEGRWIEVEEEEVIKMDPEVAYLYAKHVIKDRWPEAEEIIKTDPEIWKLYKEEIQQ